MKDRVKVIEDILVGQRKGFFTLSLLFCPEIKCFEINIPNVPVLSNFGQSYRTSLFKYLETLRHRALPGFSQKSRSNRIEWLTLGGGKM